MVVFVGKSAISLMDIPCSFTLGSDYIELMNLYCICYHTFDFFFCSFTVSGFAGSDFDLYNSIFTLWK